jgi:sulfonate transport system permease protein
LIAGLHASRVNWLGLATVCVLLLLWQVTIQTGLLSFEFLPAPSAIFNGLASVITSGDLLPEIGFTMTSVSIGWLIALVIGISAGLLLGSFSVLRRYSMATIEFLRPIPGIAFLPVGLLLFGFSTTMELFVIVLPVLWPILIGTMRAVMAVPTRLYEVSRTLRLTRAEVIRKVFLPAAAPTIFIGARISLTLALVLAVIAEMIGNPQGLGYAIVREQQAMRPDRMFAYVFVVGLLGIIINAVTTAVGSQIRLLSPGGHAR